MNKFNIGDEVEIIKGYGDAKAGLKGVIFRHDPFENDRMGIKFNEKNTRFHSLGGKIKDGYGYYVPIKHLKHSTITNWREALK